MADFTTVTAASWIPAIWSKTATVTYRSNTVIEGLLDDRWEREIQYTAGNTVNIPGFSQNNAAKNRGAGTGTFGTGAAVTFDAVTEAQTQLVINRLYYKAWRAPAELKQQMMPEYHTLLMDGAAKADALQFDADIASDGTNGFASFTTTTGTDNVDVTEDDIISSETSIETNANMPAPERYLVVSPATRGSLLKIEAYKNELYKGSVGNLDGKAGLGYIGPINSYATYKSNNLKAGAAGKLNAAFHREAIAKARQAEIQTAYQMNITDGIFDQYVTFMTAGIKLVKVNAAVGILGK